MRATWPYTARWTAALPRMVGETIAPQRSISGVETVIPTFGGRWEVTGSFVIYGEPQELAWQAFIAQMEGGVGTTLVPIWTRFRPSGATGRQVPWDNVAGIEDTQTWEHFGFESTRVAGGTIAAAAALRATTISVTLTGSLGLRPGQYFSISERLYRVQHHWQTPAGVTQLMIQPPLRAAAAVGVALEVFSPVCRMRLAEPAGDLEYTPEGVARVTCRFVEAV